MMKRLLRIGWVLALLLLAAACGKETPSPDPEPVPPPAVEAEPGGTPAPAPETPPGPAESAVPTATAAISLPFAVEAEGAKVYVKEVGSTEAIVLSDVQAGIVLQTLRLTEVKADGEWQEAASGRAAELIVEAGEDVYAGRYFFEDNLIESEGGRFAYAYDDAMMLLFHALFDPDSPPGLVGAMRKAMMAPAETGVGSVSREEQVEPERLTVRAMDYLAWEKALDGQTPLKETRYYDYEGALGRTALYEEGVLRLNLTIAFTEPGFATPDGIAVGASKDEAREKLGDPNMELPDVWGYTIGDYTRFYLFFQDDAVSVVALTIPL